MRSATELLRKYAADGAAPGQPPKVPSVQAKPPEWKGAIPFPGAQVDGREATSADWDRFLTSDKGKEYRDKGISWGKMQNFMSMARSSQNPRGVVDYWRGGAPVKFKDAPKADGWWRSGWWNLLSRGAEKDPAAAHAREAMPSDLSPFEKRLWAAAAGTAAQEAGRSAAAREQTAVAGINNARAFMNGMSMGVTDKIYATLRAAGVDVSGIGGESLDDLRGQYMEAARRQGKSDDEIQRDLCDYEYNQRMSGALGGMTTLAIGGAGKAGSMALKAGQNGGRLAKATSGAVNGFFGTARYAYPLSNLAGAASVAAAERGHDATSNVLSFVDTAAHAAPTYMATLSGGSALLGLPAAPAFPGLHAGAKQLGLYGAKYVGNWALRDLATSPFTAVAANMDNAGHGGQLEVLPNMGVIVGSASRPFFEHAEANNPYWKLYADRNHEGVVMREDMRQLYDADRELLAEDVANRYGISDDAAAEWANNAPADSPDLQSMADWRTANVNLANGVTMAMRELEPDFDWDAATPEQRQEMIARHGEKAIMDAAFPQLRIGASGGATIPEEFIGLMSDEQLGDIATVCVVGSLARAATPSVVNGGKGEGFFDPLRRGKAMLGAATGEPDKVLESAMANDPTLAAQLRPIMLEAVDRATLGGGERDENDAKLLYAYFGGLDEREKQKFTDAILKDKTPEQLKQMQSGASGMPMPKAFDDSMSRSIAKRLEEPGMLKAFCPYQAENLKEGCGMTASDRERGVKLLGMTDLTKVSDDDLYALTRYGLAMSGGSQGDVPDELKGKMDELATKVEDEWKSRFGGDMLKYLPTMASLYAAKNGFGGVADWLNSPFAFYGTALLVCAGVLWLGGSIFGVDDDDDESEPDALGLMRRRKRNADNEELGTGYLVP